MKRPWTVLIVFYAACVGVALLMRALHFGDALYAGDLGVPPLDAMLAAVAVAAVVLLVSGPLDRLAWVRRLSAMMHEIFGRLTWPQAIVLGAVSAVGEELLFRGALQPIAGSIIATVVFALLHAYSWWWLFALVIGAVFAMLYEWSGSLWPCILLHGLINTINSWRMTHDSPPPPPQIDVATPDD